MYDETFKKKRKKENKSGIPFGVLTFGILEPGGGNVFDRQMVNIY